MDRVPAFGSRNSKFLLLLLLLSLSLPFPPVSWPLVKLSERAKWRRRKKGREEEWRAFFFPRWSAWQQPPSLPPSLPPSYLILSFPRRACVLSVLAEWLQTRRWGGWLLETYLRSTRERKKKDGGGRWTPGDSVVFFCVSNWGSAVSGKVNYLFFPSSLHLELPCAMCISNVAILHPLPCFLESSKGRIEDGFPPHLPLGCMRREEEPCGEANFGGADGKSASPLISYTAVTMRPFHFAAKQKGEGKPDGNGPYYSNNERMSNGTCQAWAQGSHVMRHTTTTVTAASPPE